MVFATIFTEFAAAGKRYSKAKHLFWWEEKCHEYDLTTAPYFWFVNRTDSFRWFAISSLLLYAVSAFVLWVELEKK
jgi:hypothetical protein